MTSLTLEPRAPSRVRPWHLAVALLVVLVLIVVGMVIGGGFAAFVLSSTQAVPFAILAVLAYLGIRSLAARILAVFWTLGAIGVFAVTAFVLAVGAIIPFDASGAVAAFPPGATLAIGLAFLGTVVAFLVGSLFWIPAVRRLVARVLPIDPNSFVHAVALVIAVTFTLLGVVPLLVVGQPPLLVLVDRMGEIDTGGSSLLVSQIAGLIWIIPSAIVAVGLGTTRSFGQALERLGFLRPSVRQVGFAIVAAVVLVAIAQLMGLAIEQIWTVFGWPRTDGQAFEKLIGGLITPVGALVIGVTAGLGEELALRGVLQPRLGIVLSNLLFAIGFHSFQYSWDALIVVFTLGLVFGIVRQRTNTTTAAIVHGVYNFILVLGAALNVPWLR